ncbi:galectin-4-like isoform X1 [Homalodisca vitripennis]|uniref:galectin-4-like isoform X1 n=1 Tax=Homalodisca vitripennis TaxID=197043 RepID=UPI001EEA08A4|nr:galectin-4-like isoform X1 [Homalodisca vitripennis]
MPVPLTKIICCCYSDDNTTDKLLKKRLRDHKYCGCRERISSRQRFKMKSCDDRRTLVENEVCEALEYDFSVDNAEEEFCLTDQVTPFSHELTFALHPQSDLIIQGVVNEKAIRFSVNLLIGHNERPDIAFHLNPRLDMLYIARNTRLDGRWGMEEGSGLQNFPFVRGEPFIIEIFLTHSNFMVAVNGIHFCSYTYRTSLLNITDVEVTGAVTLSKVHLRTSQIYPAPLPSNYPPSPHVTPLESYGTTKIKLQSTPMYGILQKKLTTDSEIVITGKVQLLPNSFFVNLQQSSDIWPHPEIPFHISTRFNHERKYVILANAWIDEDWGLEEFCINPPLFIPGSEFTLRILCRSDGFVVEKDGEYLLTFRHRVPYRNIDTILIDGEIFLYNITVHL